MSKDMDWNIESLKMPDYIRRKTDATKQNKSQLQFINNFESNKKIGSYLMLFLYLLFLISH